MGQFLSTKRKETCSADVLSNASVNQQMRKFHWGESKELVEGGEDAMIPIDVVTWNMLAPCYRRIGERTSMGFRLREGHTKDAWIKRANETATFLEQMFTAYKQRGCGTVDGGPDIVCFQEFWMDEEYCKIFLPLFEKYGYETRSFKRPGNKTDSVCILTKRHQYEIEDQQNLLLLAGETRVALLLCLRHKASGRKVTIANTHLSFPHNAIDRRTQNAQMEVLIQEMNKFATKEEGSTADIDKQGQQHGVQGETPTSTSSKPDSQKKLEIPVSIVVGDFNQEEHSSVCKMLKAAGYVSCLQVCSPHQGMGDTYDSTPPTGLPAFPGSPPWRNESVDYMNDSSSGTIPSSTVSCMDSVKEGKDTGKDLPGEGKQRTRSGHEVVSRNEARFVSHRTHQLEELGVDHIFLRGGSVTEATPGSEDVKVFVQHSLVLPKSISCEAWPQEFTISDHRPVGARILVQK